MNETNEVVKVDEETIQTVRRIADILHTILCRTTHSSMQHKKRQEGVCYWYMEEQLENSWNRTDHSRWLKEALEFISDVQLANSQDAETLLLDFIKATSTLEKLLEKDPGLFKLLKKLLKL